MRLIKGISRFCGEYRFLTRPHTVRLNGSRWVYATDGRILAGFLDPKNEDWPDVTAEVMDRLRPYIERPSPTVGVRLETLREWAGDLWFVDNDVMCEDCRGEGEKDAEEYDGEMEECETCAGHGVMRKVPTRLGQIVMPDGQSAFFNRALLALGLSEIPDGPTRITLRNHGSLETFEMNLEGPCWRIWLMSMSHEIPDVRDPATPVFIVGENRIDCGRCAPDDVVGSADSARTP